MLRADEIIDMVKKEQLKGGYAVCKYSIAFLNEDDANLIRDLLEEMDIDYEYDDTYHGIYLIEIR